MSRPVLLDTDLGSDVDDAVALALLLACPELRLVAVTTVAADVRGRAWAAARLLGLGGRSEVDVCAGARDALVRRERFVWREIETEGYPPGPDARLSDEPAAERIVRAARETPGLELVAIGPLTNLAHALALDPKLPQRIARLHVMGGHIRRVAIGERVCEPGIDYNLCSDPEASTMVLGAGFATRLVTADVTLETWLRESDLARLAAAPRPVARALVPLIRLWTPWQHEDLRRAARRHARAGQRGLPARPAHRPLAGGRERAALRVAAHRAHHPGRRVPHPRGRPRRDRRADGGGDGRGCRRREAREAMLLRRLLSA